MSNLRELTEEEFQAFIETYPGRLSKWIDHSCIPPRAEYEDLSNGNIIGIVRLYDTLPVKPLARYAREPNKYFVEGKE